MKASEAVKLLKGCCAIVPVANITMGSVFIDDASPKIIDLIERQAKVVEAAKEFVECKAGFAEHCNGCDNSNICQALAEFDNE